MDHQRFKITLNPKTDKYSAYHKNTRTFIHADTKYQLWNKIKEEYNVNKKFVRKGVWITCNKDSVTQ